MLRRQVLVNLVSKCWLYGSTFNPTADLHSETSKHQDQVKDLIEKTASSLDDTALKMLFVSVQQNNIDLCVRYAIKLYVMFLFSHCLWDLTMTFFKWDRQDLRLDYCPSSSWQYKWLLRLNLIQRNMTARTLSWFRHSIVSEWMPNSLNWVFTIWNSHQWVSTQNL